jgi:hypothetical protein
VLVAGTDTNRVEHVHVRGGRLEGGRIVETAASDAGEKLLDPRKLLASDHGAKP